MENKGQNNQPLTREEQLQKMKEQKEKEEKERKERRLRNLNKALDLIEDSMEKIDTAKLNLDMRIAIDYTNPQKEEIVRQLSELPELINYYGQMKSNAMMYLDWFEYNLFVAERNARQAVRDEYNKETKKLVEEINESLRQTLLIPGGDEKTKVASIKLLQDLVKAAKSKELSDREIEFLISPKVQKEREVVMEWKKKVNKFREFHESAKRKLDSVRSLKSLVIDDTNYPGSNGGQMNNTSSNNNNYRNR